jgi:hypothetical protein
MNAAVNPIALPARVSPRAQQLPGQFVTTQTYRDDMNALNQTLGKLFLRIDDIARHLGVTPNQ